MRFFILLLIGFFVAPAYAVEIPLNGTVQIEGPFQPDESFSASIYLSVSAQISSANYDPTNPVNTSTSYAVYTDIGGPTVEFGSRTGALGDLEAIGGMFASCTSCSQSAELIWFSSIYDPIVYTYTITTSTQFLFFGPGPISAIATLDLELPDGFSVASPIPEPSTWAMLLIGFAGIGFAGYRRYQLPKPAGGVPT
jgi:PEP-CTERM motif